MNDFQAGWALATVEVAGAPVACIEAGGALYGLAPTLARAGLPGIGTVAALFADWGKAAAALDRAVGLVDPADRVEPTRRLAPLLYPGKILCAGANYFDHLAEMGMPGAKKADQRLFFFMKPPRNAVVGEGDTVHMPIATKAFDWEVELAAVIGTTARNVTVEDAMTHVAGWTVAIDFSARDHNRAAETFYKLDWVAGKGNDTCCPLGAAHRALRGPVQPAGYRADLGREWGAQAGWPLGRHDLLGRRADQHRLPHHDARPGRRGAHRHPRRGGRAQGHLSRGRRQGGRRGRGYRHAVRPHPARAVGKRGDHSLDEAGCRDRLGFSSRWRRPPPARCSSASSRCFC